MVVNFLKSKIKPFFQLFYLLHRRTFQVTMSEVPSLEERYRASMVLSGVGDAMGYRNSKWEFCYSGKKIHQQLSEIGGLDMLVIAGPEWIVSDDTVMHIATAEALVEASPSDDEEKLYMSLAKHYIACMKDMTGRAPGNTCIASTAMLDISKPKGYRIPFNERGGGCGAAMRGMAIGLRYPRPEDLDELIAVSVEAGRMTHNLPLGYLGSLVAALFTHYAIQRKPVHEWGAALMSIKDKVLQYVVTAGIDVDKNKKFWEKFWAPWSEYLELRGLEDGTSQPKFPMSFGIEERDQYYNSLSSGGWGGSAGHDSVIISYDALLGAGDSWHELCLRGMLHGGDNDSTGAISGAWFGALYGFPRVPPKHFEGLEYRSRLEDLAAKLHKQSGLTSADTTTHEVGTASDHQVLIDCKHGGRAAGPGLD